MVDDELLVRADPMAPTAGQDAPEAGPQCTVLAWDERMTLHAEGRHNPHPERPDRLRAVMARLLDSGLAGAGKSPRLRLALTLLRQCVSCRVGWDGWDYSVSVTGYRGGCLRFHGVDPCIPVEFSMV